MTSAARVPFVPSAPMSAGMVLGGVTITASSGASGRSSMLAKHVPAADHLVLRIDEIDRSGEAARRGAFSVSLWPTEPTSSLAPITAIERGLSACSRFRMVMQAREVDALDGARPDRHHFEGAHDVIMLLDRNVVSGEKRYGCRNGILSLHPRGRLAGRNEMPNSRRVCG